jgi:hypothetical protein
MSDWAKNISFEKFDMFLVFNLYQTFLSILPLNKWQKTRPDTKLNSQEKEKMY